MIDIKALSDKMAALKQEMRDHGKEALQAEVKKFFEKWGDAAPGAIRWRQYSPFFNDGDACEFSVHGVYAFSSPNCETPEDGSEEEDDYEGLSLYNYGPGYKRLDAKFPWVADFEALASVIEGNEDLMEAAFGNHVQVTCTAAGIEVDDYDHD